MTTTHLPPKNGEHLTAHRIGPDCPCKPQRIADYKAASSGRGGRHQGYNVKHSYQHNPLPKKG